MDKPLQIDYYSDVLCVWAWIAQRRLEELNRQWGNQIRICHYYVDVFGDVEQKIENAWADRGRYSGFASHVQEAVHKFDEIKVHPELWQETRPKTSANAHLVIKAIELVHGEDVAGKIDFEIRQSFFLEARDIGHMDFLFDVLEHNQLDPGKIRGHIENGAAMASLLRDYRQAQSKSIQGSPTYVLDGGRQVLFGNVGYRVIHANIEELLRKPVGEASWC